jgi:hypothetical protein
LVIVSLLWYEQFVPNRESERVYQRFGHWLDETVFRDTRITDQRNACRRLTSVVELAEQDLIEDTLTMPAAVTRVLRACREHYPEFLAIVAIKEEGATSEEQVGRHLLRFIRERPEVPAAVMERLEMQLAEMLAAK